MKPTDLDYLVDTCLDRLHSGATIEQCLADYPDNAHELRPLLLAALAVQASPIPTARPQAVKLGQIRMLAALDSQGKNAAVSFGTLRRYAERIQNVLKQEEASKMRLALRSIVTTVLFLFVSGFFALAISSNSLPGEPFYPVKRGWESTRLNLTFDAEARQLFEEQIQQNRQQELTALIELGRQTQIVYEGFVEQIEESQLIVDSFIFQANEQTLWLHEPEIGEAVQIETEITAEGDLLALEISASSLNSRPTVIQTVTATPCNSPACQPPTATSTPCNDAKCKTVIPTPNPPTVTKTLTAVPTSSATPCNEPTCNSGTITPTSTPFHTVTASPTQPNGATATPCNTPACGTVQPTSPPPSTATSPPPTTSTPCNTPSCGTPPATSTPFPLPTDPPGNPTATPCNAPACGTPQPTHTPHITATPPNNPSATPCNSPACDNPSPTPPPLPTSTQPPSPQPSPTLCNMPSCK